MEKDVLKLLEKLDIKYELVEHPAVFTVEEAIKMVPPINGVGCKNLFLEDNNNDYYIYVLEETDRADFEYLSEILGLSKIKFASEKDLFNKTKLTRGSVTPLGIVNNEEKDIIILLDKKLVGKKILMHPNINTKTLSIEFNDLIKVIDNVKSKYIIV
jgi:Ala-tRNA(Pro) deacylase